MSVTQQAVPRLRQIAEELRQIATDLDPQAPPAPTVNTSLTLGVGQVFTEPQEKDLIVLHFTAGSNASGAVAHWKSLTERIGTAYIIERDGVIHQVFPPNLWAYHLRIASTHGIKHDQRSIGIELVNVGPLKYRGGHLCWWPRDWSQAYCITSQKDLYVEEPWRGMDAYATFTEAQYDALNVLIPYLRREFNIPAEVSDFEMDVTQARSFRGIASHHNFRKDKFDVGPAFDWDRLRVGT